MTRLVLLLLLVSVPSYAETITWFSSNTVSSVSSWGNIFFPGLVPGTPWTLTVTFDPNAGPTKTIFPGCNEYSLSASTLTMGPYSYTHSTGGQAYTNAALPEIGCSGLLPEGESGLIQFWMGTGGWQSDDPNAWDLARWGGVTFAGYYDLLATDGNLPLVPTFNPTQGRYAGMEIENAGFLGGLLFGGIPRFQLLEQPQPAPVPEPATVTLFGAGLAALIARRRRKC